MSSGIYNRSQRRLPEALGLARLTGWSCRLGVLYIILFIYQVVAAFSLYTRHGVKERVALTVLEVGVLGLLVFVPLLFRLHF